MSNIHMANGAKFHAKDDMIVRWERAEKKVFEPETTKFIMSHLAGEREQVFIDVGAATGWFTIPVALSGTQVVAIEANRRVAARLAENLILNGLDDSMVDIVNAAASDKVGKTTFWYNRTLPLTSGGSVESATCGNPKSETVGTVKLDQWAWTAPKLIKIDVEGHEMAVLAGAEETIHLWKPCLVLEANTEAHYQQLAEWLKARDYAFMRADTRNILAVPACSS